MNMKRPITILAVLILWEGILHAQNFEWVRSMGEESFNRSYSVAVDDSGNVYTTGYFLGTADFDPGAGTFNLTSAGSDDIFVQKLDASGNFMWAKSMGGTSYDYGFSIAVDGSGNVYTTGHFFGTADMDPGPAIFNLGSITGISYFVQKLDASGNFLWAKSITGFSSDDEGPSIAVDDSCNVYTIGFFNGTVDFDPGAGTVNQTTAGGRDIFIQKLDSAGNFLWVRSIGGSSTDQGASIIPDHSGNLYITGSFEDTADFDPGTGTANLISAGNADVFVEKLDASGNFIWAKSMGGTGPDYGKSIVVDASGNTYVVGSYYYDSDFDPGAGTFILTAAGHDDIFVQKLDASGNFVWAKSIAGPSYDVGFSIALDGLGNVYTTGYFGETVDFDPGFGTFNITSAGYLNFFVLSLDTSGNFVWANSCGGVSGDVGYSIAADVSGNVYTTGTFEGTIDFDPGAGTTNLTSIGVSDIFVQKLSQTTGINETVNDINITAYPNPSTGSVSISFGQTLNNAELTLTDVLGHVVTQKSYTTLQHTTFALPETSGLYFLSIKAKEGSSTVRLLRE